MKELSRALADFATVFERLGVRYAVMGGIAVRTHGIPRPTQDVDFTVAIERGRKTERIDDLAMPMVTPEDLILLKLIARRPRDFADIGDILFTQGQLDEVYLRRWATELGILPDLEAVLAEPPPI